MKTHPYKLPERGPSPWDGLSAEAMSALTGIAMGSSAASELITGHATTKGELDTSGLRHEVIDWARTELDSEFPDGALRLWQRYEAKLGMAVPANVNDLLRTNPNLVSTLNRLYDAKNYMSSSILLSFDGLNISETMRLLVVPWQAFSDNRTNVTNWMTDMRDIQGIMPDSSKALDIIIKEDRPLYRDAANPSHILTSTEYLAQKIEQDGPWGIVLIQCSDRAGIAIDPLLPAHSPDEMTQNGTNHLRLNNGSAIDNIGIYEWTSLTLQEEPATLSSNCFSLMLANRLEHSGDTLVPRGTWCSIGNTGMVSNSLVSAAGHYPHNTMPRLMVM